MVGDYSPDSFSAIGITRFPEEGGALGAAQHLADRARPITKLASAASRKNVSVTPSTSVRVCGNVVGEIHDIYSGGARRDLEP